VIYTNLLRIYAKHQLIDRAISLSRRLRGEQLSVPQFYEILGELIESQYTRESNQQAESVPVQQPYHPYYNNMVPVPTQVGVHYLPGDASYQYYYPVQGYYPGYYPQQQSEVSPTPPYPNPTPDQSVTSESPTLMSLGGESFYSAQTDQTFLHRQLKRAVNHGEAEKGLSIYLSLERSGKVVNVTETSSLIEQLVRADLTHEATEITQSMLVRNTHPLPKIFRFLLNKLAITGAVEDINAIGQFLSTKIKKDVSYDNRLCNAYLSAGRGAEFLDLLVSDLDRAVQEGDEEMMKMIQDRFPRGGAMGLLDNHPELLDRFTVLAQEFANTGYVAPMNVLWTYHFINDNSEVADSIWEKYVKSSNQIMFQKVCQVARSTGNLNLAFGLVSKLADADQVTPGARGIAYSCLLDCLCTAEKHKQGWNVLQDALSRGVELEDVNRTALVRLKTGLETQGQRFPYTIPPKNPRREDRSLSPSDWNEM
jgi:pentatricopeptide repeat protein